MYEYDDDYPMYKNIQFEGRIIALIDEDACLTAVIKVLDIEDNTGIKKGDIRLLKFNTYLYNSDESALPLYDEHFLFQLTGDYDFECNYDLLIGKCFSFFYTGKHVELSPGLYQYRFISAIPIDDINSEHTHLNPDATDESNNYNLDLKHPINNNAENSIDPVEHYSLYKVFWIPKETAQLYEQYSSFIAQMEYLSNSSYSNAFRDKKAEGSADADADSSHSIHVDQNMKSLINALGVNSFGDIDG